MKIFASILISLLSLGLYAQTANSNMLHELNEFTFTDMRDGRIYTTVQLGAHIWMAENLDYNAGKGCSAYNNDSSYAASYGLLYNWETAKNSCPSGWHLPSDAEWEELEIHIGMSPSDAKYSGWRGADKVNALKSTSGWSLSDDEIGKNGFSVLPSGYGDYDNNFHHIAYACYFWSSSEYFSYYAWVRAFNNYREDIFRRYRSKHFYYSVRCIKD